MATWVLDQTQSSRPLLLKCSLLTYTGALRYPRGLTELLSQTNEPISGIIELSCPIKVQFRRHCRHYHSFLAPMTSHREQHLEQGDKLIVHSFGLAKDATEVRVFLVSRQLLDTMPCAMSLRASGSIQAARPIGKKSRSISGAMRMVLPTP